MVENYNNEKRIKVNNKYYIVLQLLGRGTYGEVYKIKDPENNQEYALKKSKLENDSQGVSANSLREITILRNINHDNIVKLHTLEVNEKNILLCLEYCEYDLDKYWNTRYSNSSPDLRTIKKIMYQILLGMDHLHGKKVLHRDLKPQNILINSEGKVKITDFGLSRTYSIPIKVYTKEILSLWYRAPELVLGMDYYSIGIDMWSIGCIFAELILKKPIFKSDSEINLLFKQFKILGKPDEKTMPGFKTFPLFNSRFPDINKISLDLEFKGTCAENSKEAIDLLNKMFIFNPAKRITCREALKDKFFEEILKKES